MKTLWVTAIRFKRSAESDTEEGVAIGTDPGTYHMSVIVDMTGHVVLDAQVWNYEVDSYKGAFVLKGENNDRS
jgi:hypothetical protein